MENQQVDQAGLAHRVLHKGVSLASYGTAVGIGLLLIVAVIPNGVLHPFFSDVGILLGVIVFSLTVGTAIAHVIVTPMIAFFDRRIEFLRHDLQGFGQFGKWPGRRFLEILRLSRLSQYRRDFLTLGLDTSFRLPTDVGTAYVEKLSSLLFTLQSEAEARGFAELEAVAHEARAIVQRYSQYIKLRGVFEWLVLISIPSALAYLTSILIEWTYDKLPESLHHATFADVDKIPYFVGSVALVAFSPLVVYGVGQVMYLLTWNLGEKTRTNVDDVFLLVFSWSVAGMAGMACLYFSLSLFEHWPVALRQAVQTVYVLITPSQIEHDSLKGSYLQGMEEHTTQVFLLRAAFIMWGAAMFILLLRNLCERVFKELAARTQQKHDDMVVELVKIFGTFIIGAIGTGWIYLAFVAQLSEKVTTPGGTSALMPYAILVAVSGALLGIGSRDLLENFFAGISLQIDKPFESGERVVLEGGDICEVRTIGMRSTHFFNIIDNTDLYVPNTKLAQQSVTNLSRPDREYRRILTTYVVDKDNENNDTLLTAEGLLLLAAFSIEGVDVPTVVDEQYEFSMFQKNRPGIVAEFSKLQDQFDECANAVIKFHGRLRPVGELVQDTCRRISRSIHDLAGSRNERWDSEIGRPRPLPADGTLTEDLRAAGLKAHRVSHGFYELAMCFHTLRASYPTLRADLEHLTLELLRAPSVKSEHFITEEGNGLWELHLMFYAHLTEQSDEIVHHLNMYIQQVLNFFGLLPAQRPDSRQRGPDTGELPSQNGNVPPSAI